MTGYFRGGAGTPLLLLHGLTGTWHIWRPVLDQLVKHHQVDATTLPGHYGGAPLAEGVEATVQSLADAIIADCRSRGIESAHVVGNSLGGYLSLELARRGFARSVVALSPAGGWRTEMDYKDISGSFATAAKIMPWIVRLLSWLLRVGPVRRMLARQTMERADRMPFQDFRDGLVAFTNTVVLQTLLVTLGRDGPLKPLNAPGIPIRIVWGDHDRVIPFERYGKPMLESVPQAELVMLKNAGHVPMYDEPDTIVRLILEVTSAADAASPSTGAPA